MMEKWAPSDAGFDIDGLHLALWFRELLHGGITEITSEKPEDVTGDEATWTLHSYRKVPKRSLVIRVDPEHDDPAPEGTQLIARGSARIEGDVTKVSLFRKL